jgi:hypothetical protein
VARTAFVEVIVVLGTRAATVEALETDVEAMLIVLL